MKLLLAPMEGLLDYTLRDILTRVGGLDGCVSEFIRITGQLLPARVFTRIVPELRHGSRTPAGVLVRPQLLGSDPACMADNAAVLASLSPAGIDLNFGCPAKTVNQHRGGAVLLDEPELVGRHRGRGAPRRAGGDSGLGQDAPGQSLRHPRRWNARRPLTKPAPASWWCMRAPRRMATVRPPTGSGCATCARR